MINPSPTQQPRKPPASEPQKIKSTPARRRMGETPAARFVKGILRPFCKSIYYTLQFVRGHKLLTIGAIFLLLASISITNYLTTGLWPFSIGSDPFKFQVSGTQGSGEAIRNWLYALRDGDATTLQLLDADMSQPPNAQDLISQYGQTQGRTWKAIRVISSYSQNDSTVDSFVTIEFSSAGPGGNTDGIAIWHFVTITQQREYLLSATLVDMRKPLR